MMRTAIVGTLAVLALPLLSACGRIEPVQDGVPPHPTSVENEDAVLSVEPGAVGACEGQRVAARIAWKVKDPAVQSVLVQVRGNFFKRVFYSYFLRDMSLASLELLAGCALVLFGAVFGLYHWGLSVSTGAPASTGTVMLAALPLLVGLQLLLAFLAYDIASVPRKVLSSRLGLRLRGR